MTFHIFLSRDSWLNYFHCLSQQPPTTAENHKRMSLPRKMPRKMLDSNYGRRHAMSLSIIFAVFGFSVLLVWVLIIIVLRLFFAYYLIPHFFVIRQQNNFTS